jgi:hypothetical protein
MTPLHLLRGRLILAYLFLIQTEGMALAGEYRDVFTLNIDSQALREWSMADLHSHSEHCPKARFALLMPKRRRAASKVDKTRNVFRLLWTET